MTRLKGNLKAKARRKKRVEKNKKFQGYKSNLLSKIRKYDDPILKEKCKEVILIDNKFDDETKNIIKLLGKVLVHTSTGIGLSAPQIGHAVNIFAIRPDTKTNDVQFFINPEIIFVRFFH